jgi:hypothetical protein
LGEAVAAQSAMARLVEKAAQAAAFQFEEPMGRRQVLGAAAQNRSCRVPKQETSVVEGSA